MTGTVLGAGIVYLTGYFDFPVMRNPAELGVRNRRMIRRCTVRSIVKETEGNEQKIKSLKKSGERLR